MTAHAKLDRLERASCPSGGSDDLFSGRDDPRIEAELAEAARGQRRAGRAQGRVRRRPRRRRSGLARCIAEGVGLYEQATNRLWAVGAYASLAASVARDDPAWSKFESDIRARAAEIGGREPLLHAWS